MKVENFKHANQFIITGNEGITFQSYKSEIAKIDNKGNLTLGIDWDYSKTTLTHLYMFLDEHLYNMNENNRQYFKYEFLNSKNKKAYIQKLIDKKIIKYDENMR